MRNRILVLFMLAAFYPFMAGQSGGGCGGQLQDQGLGIGAETEAEAVSGTEAESSESSAAQGGLAPDVDEALPVAGAPDDSGAAKLVCPAQETEPSSAPPCLGFLPAGADVYMMLDVESVLAHLKDIEAVGAFSLIMDQVGAGVEALAREEKPDEFARRMKEICFACVLSEEEASAQKKTLMTSGDKGSALACDEMIIINVFKEPYDFAAAIPPEELAKSKAGTVLVSDQFAAIQATDNVVALGGKLLEKMQASSGVVFSGDLGEEEAKLLMLASPATLSILSTNAGLRMFRAPSVLDLFKPAFKLVKFDYESRVLAALNFSDLASLSAAVYDAAKAQAGEMALVMKSYVQMPYDEFMFLVQQFSDESAVVKSDSADVDVLQGKLKQVEAEIQKLEAKLSALQSVSPYDAEQGRLLEERIAKLQEEAAELRRKIKALLIKK